MSGWDAYIDSCLGFCKGSADSVCMIGLDGGGIWTSSAHANHLAITGKEAVAIAGAMKSQSYDSLRAGGIHVAGVKYMYLRDNADLQLVLGKKKDHGAISIQASTTAIVIAHTAEGQQHGSTNNGLSQLVDYLTNSGF